ncbi:MAG TPA: phenylalanine--tRNA ligase subunit alpha, partial [Cyclobacteriaceae bacterium]|nr:phenylalanine--tRNA ligase subunit alpha [Cyclobacteriaceae bacterium]
MEERIQKLLAEVQAFNAQTKDALEAFRLKFISRKGAVTELFEELKKVSVEEKKRLGKVLNELKQSAEAKFSSLQENIDNNTSSSSDIDLTLPPVPNKVGN